MCRRSDGSARTRLVPPARTVGRGRDPGSARRAGSSARPSARVASPSPARPLPSRPYRAGARSHTRPVECRGRATSEGGGIIAAILTRSNSAGRAPEPGAMSDDHREKWSASGMRTAVRRSGASPEVLDQHQVAGVAHVPQIEDRHAVGRHRETERQNIGSFWYCSSRPRTGLGRSRDSMT